MVLAAPAAVVAALVALLFLLAYGQLSNSAKSSLHFSVGVGPFTVDLLGWVIDFADYVYAVWVAILDGLIAPVGNLILGPINAVMATTEATKGALDTMAAAIVTLTTSTLPQIVFNATTDPAGVLDGVNSIIKGYTAQLETDITNLDFGFAQRVYQVGQTFGSELDEVNSRIDALIAGGLAATVDVPGLVASAVSSAVTGALSTVESDIAGAVTTADSYAAGLFATAEHDITSVEAQVAGLAQTSAAALVGVIATDIDQAITGAAGVIATDIDATITQVQGILGTGDAAIGDALRGIDLTKVTDLAGVVSLAGATALTLTRYLRDCGIPNCDSLGQFGKDLSGLGAVVADGSLIALLVEMIHNPSQGAAIYQQTFGGIVDGAVTAARELLTV